MIKIIRCPDFPFTDFMRSHLESRFTHEFAKYRSHASLVEVSVRSLQRNAREGEDVLVHVTVNLRGMENVVVAAVSHNAHVAINMAARRARREVRRQVRRHRKPEQGGMRRLFYTPHRPACENG